MNDDDLILVRRDDLRAAMHTYWNPAQNISRDVDARLLAALSASEDVAA